MRPAGLLENVPLAPACTIGVGGPARFLWRAASAEAVAEASRWARREGLPVLVLGGGSNLVVADEGFPGLVLEVAVAGLASRVEGSAVLVRAGAGEAFDSLVAHAVARGWSGLECLSGIPGRVGATPVQNVGAYGQEVAETVDTLDVVELDTGRGRRLAGTECGFSYRHSRFKAADRGRFAVVSVTFRLRTGPPARPRYADLLRVLDERGLPAGLREIREAVLEVRRRKSMVVDPADPDSRSVGSFFTNPVMSAAGAEEVLRRSSGERPPTHLLGDGTVKLPAAWLIEQAGFRKGEARGRVALSRHHALAIVNRGGATAAEVVSFAREIRLRVAESFGVLLEPEPVLVGLEA